MTARALRYASRPRLPPRLAARVRARASRAAAPNADRLPAAVPDAVGAMA